MRAIAAYGIIGDIAAQAFNKLDDTLLSVINAGLYSGRQIDAVVKKFDIAIAHELYWYKLLKSDGVRKLLGMKFNQTQLRG